MNLVFDTSLLIDNLRGGKQLENVYLNTKQDDRLLLPTIVITELFSGLSSKEANIIRKIKLLVSHFEKIQLTESIAQETGVLIRNLGKIVELPDFIIAATAMEIGAQVVTLNNKHFQKIPGVGVWE